MFTKSKDKTNPLDVSYRIHPAVWIVTFIAVACIFFMHIYSDILITAKQGMNFWNCLFAGKPLSFYKEAVFELEKPYDGYLYHAAYPFTVYLLFAVWELPVWVLGKIAQTDLFNTALNFLWLKVLLLAFVVLCMQQFYKVVSHIERIKDKAHVAVYLFLSSAFLLTATGIASQYDIITLFFILCGIDAWICEKYSRFFWLFTIAISFKYFALMFFIPLLLIKEKKLLKVLGLAVSSVLPTLALWLVFPKPEGQISNVKRLFGMFTTETISLGKGSVIPFLVIMILVCAYAFFFVSEDRIQNAVFLLFIVSGAFCFVANTYPYWTVLTAPIFILVVFLCRENVNKALWCETIMCAGLVAINYIRYGVVFSSKTLLAMRVFPALFGISYDSMANTEIGIHSILSRLPVSEGMYYSVIICSWLFLIYLYKSKNKKSNVLEPLTNGSIILRSVVNVGIAMLPLFVSVAYFVAGIGR